MKLTFLLIIIFLTFPTRLFAEETPQSTEPPKKIEKEIIDEQSQNTLFKNGVYAACYGDLGVHSGKILGYNAYSIDLKAGWQLFRIYPVALTGGISWVGLGKKLRFPGEAPKELQYGYYGPVAELFLFPRFYVYPSVSYLWGTGMVYFQKAEEDKIIQAKASVSNISFNLAVRIYHESQVLFSFIQESMTANKITNVDEADKKWSSFMLAFRGSML
jgi:hypothetical protein